MLRIDSPNGRKRSGLFVLALLMTSRGVLAGSTTYYEFDAKQNLTRSYLYTAAGGVTLSGTVTQYDELGRRTQVRRLFAGNLATDDSNDDITLYVYDVAGHISKQVQKGLGSTSPTTVDASKDAIIQYDYDALGRRVTSTDPSGGKTVMVYDAAGNVVTRSVLVQGATYGHTITEYDNLNRAESVTDPTGHYREYTYNTRSLRIKEIARNGGDTALSQSRFYYDKAGRQITIARMADATSTGNVSLTTDEVTEIAYDNGGRETTRTRFNMNASTPLRTINLYDGLGRLTKTTDPSGGYVQMLYNSVGTLTERWVYDEISIRTFRLTYGEPGQLTRQIAVAAAQADDLTTLYSYDGADRRTRVTDPKGQVTDHVYDMLGRQVTLKESVGTLNRLTESTYDRLGRLTRLTAFDNDASPQEQYTYYGYDLAGHRTLIQYPDASPNAVTYAFDYAGRMTKRTDQTGTHVTYAYDHRGLLLTQTDPTHTKTFAYDGLGRMTLAKKGTSGNDDAVSNTTFEYDALSRVTQEFQGIFDEATAKTLRYSYDQAGNRITLLYDPSGAASLSLAYAYDELSQNTKIRGKYRNSANTLTQHVDLVTYDYTGRNLSRRRLQTLYKFESASAASELYLDYVPAYDQHRFTTRISNKTALGTSALDELARFDYTYDKVGNRLSNTGNRGTGSNAEGFSKIQKLPTYAYDDLHRLISARYDLGSGNTKNENFVYDHLGNRVTYQDVRNSITTAYAHNAANEYTTIGSRAVSYDPKGNFERDINGSWTTTYTYDHDNRLKKIEMDNGLLFSDRARFEYDALGRMISSYRAYDADTSGKTETLKFYHDGANVVAEYDLSNNLSRRHVHGRTYVDERAVLLEGNGATGTLDSYYYLLQELSTVTGLMKKNGTLAEAYVYDAYGKVTLWGYRNFDFDRDGDVDSGDYGIVLAAGEFDCCPTSDPMTDGDMDGDCDENDLLMVQQTSSGAPPITLHTSGVGNPYFFTGRRLHLYENLALSGVNPNKQVQYNRARHYSPEDGRWLQRDPFEFVDGLNLHQYTRSRPLTIPDPFGLWTIYREGAPRALAVSESGDTVASLASYLRLDAFQYGLWLWPLEEHECCAYPESQGAPIDGSCNFSIPNTVTLVWGQLPGIFSGWYSPFSIWWLIRANLEEEKNAFSSRGFFISELTSPNSSTVISALEDFHLFVFLFGGHGLAGGGLLPEGDPEDPLAAVNENDYRTGSLHNIAGMKLLSCYSADQTCIADLQGLPFTTWRDNVSSNGIFIGILGSATSSNHNIYSEIPPP